MGAVLGQKNTLQEMMHQAIQHYVKTVRRTMKMIHSDVEMTMLTGYPTADYMDYEKESSSHDQLVEAEYDDSNILFETLEGEI